MRTVRFRLRISTEKLEQFYRGDARMVRALSDTGLRIAFQAKHLRPFVTMRGVHGRFVMELDEDNKMLSLRKLPEDP